MSNPSKGAHLWLRAASGRRQAVWVILDNGKQVSTRCAAAERDRAERRLRDYLASKHQPARESELAPASVLIADVLHIYFEDRKDKVARPRALAQRIRFLALFFAQRTLADLNDALYREYERHRGSAQAVRRELEDLRAATNHHWKRGYCDRPTVVTLPEKSASRERWLTRSEAARLIWTAWRKPQRQHVARFILVGLYTGTRASAICAAALHAAEGKGLVDTDSGLFYRLALGRRQTNKRQPTIRIPLRLLAHLRRWRARGIATTAVVEFEGRPVASVKKAFARTVAEAGLDGVTQHTLRHTAITWAMQNQADIYEAAGFFGVSPRLIEQVYGHHHPDHQHGVGAAVTARPATVGQRLT